MISIVIPLYNKRALIGRTLASVAAGDLRDCEIVVVDDGSTDGSAEEARRAADSLGLRNLRIVARENGGVAGARNRGVAEARGELIAFIDADDEWKADHIRTLKELVAAYPQCAVFATGYDDVMADGRTVTGAPGNLTFEGGRGVLDNYFEVASETRPPLWTSALMVRREALTAVGGFPEGERSGEDLLTWARLACRFGIACDVRSTARYNHGFSNPRPPEAVDVVGRSLEELYRATPHVKGLKRYVARWYNMRMSRCLAHRMYGQAAVALWRSLRYRPTVRILKPLLHFTLHGLRHRPEGA